MPLSGDANVAPVATLLADPARAAMLFALSDGRALPAGELARIGRVTPPTASAHLSKLVAGGLLAVVREGRHRYYRLANPVIVRALEALAAVASPGGAVLRKDSHAVTGVRFARTCYDHLAGQLGVRITDALVEQGCLVLAGRAYEITTAGEDRLGALGLDIGSVRQVAQLSRRIFTRACLDWSERRYHVAGALGAAFCERLLELAWLERIHATRAVRVTNAGRRALRKHFGVVAY